MLVTLSLKAAQKLGRWQLFDCKGARHQFAYAGNVAWVFICADRAMTSDSENLIGGNAFFASDDTPLTDIYEFVKPFATCNFKISSFKLPMWSVFIPVYILHGTLWSMSPFFKPKFSFEPVHEISNNVVCATIKASDQPAHTRSLIRAFASRLSIL